MGAVSSTRWSSPHPLWKTGQREGLTAYSPRGVSIMLLLWARDYYDSKLYVYTYETRSEYAPALACPLVMARGLDQSSWSLFTVCRLYYDASMPYNAARRASGNRSTTRRGWLLPAVVHQRLRLPVVLGDVQLPPHAGVRRRRPGQHLDGRKRAAVAIPAVCGYRAIQFIDNIGERPGRMKSDMSRRCSGTALYRGNAACRKLAARGIKLIHVDPVDAVVGRHEETAAWIEYYMVRVRFLHLLLTARFARRNDPVAGRSERTVAIDRKNRDAWSIRHHDVWPLVSCRFSGVRFPVCCSIE